MATKFVDGQPVEMTSEEVNALQEPLASRRERIWTAIKQERDRRRLEGGVMVLVSGVPKWFHSDTLSRTQHLGLVIAGPNMPATDWRTMDGSYVSMHQGLALQIFAAAASSDAALFAFGKQLQDQVTQSDNPEALDIRTGWPPVFDEQQ
jgi:hypothetical protein